VTTRVLAASDPAWPGPAPGSAATRLKIIGPSRASARTPVPMDVTPGKCYMTAFLTLVI